jgi:hypothetical protein
MSEMNLNPYEAPSEPKSTRDEPTRVYRDAEDELLDNNTGVRILGSFALVIGSWIGYSTIYVPLNEALAQSQSIRVNRSMIVVSLASTIWHQRQNNFPFFPKFDSIKVWVVR